MKYKVVIADDNPLICKALEKTIDWEKRDCIVAGTAGNGWEAVDLISSCRPEIIITDIKMPGMDGLELITEVKKSLPDTQVIMITGYQEFEYAKRAISLGVLDLILKPIDNEKLMEVVDKAIGNLSDSQNLKDYYQKLKDENEKYKNKALVSRNILRSRIVRDLITQRRRPEEVSGEELESLGMGGWKYDVVIARARTSCSQSASRMNSLMTKTLYRLENPERIIELVFQQNMVFLIGSDEEFSSRSNRIHLKNLLLLIQEEVTKTFGKEKRMCFSVSRTTSDIRKVRSAYEQADAVMKTNYFSAKEDLLFSAGNPETIQLGVYSMVKELDSFYQMLETMPEKDAEQEIDMIIQRILESSAGDEFKIKCFLSEICITLLRHYDTYLPDAAGKSVTRVLEEINHLVDIEQARIYLKEIIFNIQKEMKNSRKMKNPLAIQALDYMKVHYRENITLSSLAEYLSANTSYLSRLLKKETGSNFVDLLAGIRISAAKQLLLEEGSRVNEVGDKVGYSDYTYFYQVFKRLEGVAPGEYKKKGKKI